jgi:hypothetical protein
MEMGRNEQAITVAKRAVELDPLSLAINASDGSMLDAIHLAGRPSRGLRSELR